MSEAALPHAFGVVAIGRNEGERLRRCLESVVGLAKQVVYVDSGSTDDSVNMARAMGVEVIELDLTIPFTAARARNEGFRRARDLRPDVSYVQFVDGDCEVVAEWLPRAVEFLTEHSDVAVVCGRRRERYPEHSVYNALCDIEWDTPVGQANACGGDAMMRVDALEAAGGYRASLIAGEEPELCVRLRASGWKIWRLDSEMTLHDAAMTRFQQWWKRAMRGGHAYAEGAHLHGAEPFRHKVAETRRALLWGLVYPATSVILGLLNPGWYLLLLAYPLRMLRMAAGSTLTGGIRWWRAFYLVLGSFPEAIGVLKYQANRLQNKQAALIEYK